MNDTTEITVWPGMGVEIAADRRRTWVARAASLADGRVVVELLDPIPGTGDAAVPLLVSWSGQWMVDTIALDPRSPSATLLDPLKAGGMSLRLADAIGMATAHGAFQDLLAAGRLRVRGHDALDRAAAQAQERKLAGSRAVDRYAGVDQAALVAAELAVWVLDDSMNPASNVW